MTIKKKINTQNKIHKKILFILLFLQLLSCTKEQFNVETIETKQGWGYTISDGDKVLIKQTIIPAISKNKNFISEDDALKVANLAVKKLRQNKSPSITKKDLILLKIKI